MKPLFVPYELAVKLKDAGFNELCLAGFLTADEGQFNVFGMDTNHEWYIKNSDEEDSWLTAPLYQQVVDWLRDKHNVCIYIHHSIVSNFPKQCTFTIKYSNAGSIELHEVSSNYYTTLTKAIEEALKLITNILKRG